MKKLILTIAMGEYHTKMGEVTHPLLEKYAQKVGADFMVIREQKVSQTTPHWEKFQIYDLFETYDRIIFFDTDMLVRDDCPDLFALVSETSIGAYNEAPCAGRGAETMAQVAALYGIAAPPWRGVYMNTGMMVLSKCHQELFRKPEKELFHFYEQSYLNLVFAQSRVLFVELDWRFNRMHCMEPYGVGHRLDAYVVHYAGYEDSDPTRVIDFIAHDRRQWERALLA